MYAFDKDELIDLYVNQGLTDRQIGDLKNIDRSWIVHLRKKYGIKSRVSNHEIALSAVIDQLLDRGFEFKNLKEHNKTANLDLLVNGKHRCKVMSSVASEIDYYKFSLTTSAGNNTIASEDRVILRNGRHRLKFEKVCDYLILVGINNKRMSYWILPSDSFSNTLQSISTSHSKDSKYNVYLNNWTPLETN
ncbi:hypothetical protein ACI2JA_03855 [Alkalihalobacillus sp. NPDC078783]